MSKLIFPDSMTSTNHLTNLGPAITVFNGVLWSVFRADNDSCDLLAISSSDGINWSTDTKLNATSKSIPALTSFKGMLYCAHVANNDSHDILLTRSSDGVTWSPINGNGKVNGISSHKPSLGVFNSELYCAYTDINDNSAVTITKSSDGVNWSPIGEQIKIGELANYSPALVQFQNRLYCIISAKNETNTLLILKSDNGTIWNRVDGTTLSAGEDLSLTVVDNMIYGSFRMSNEVMFISSYDGIHWGYAQNSPRLFSSAAPSITNFQNKLYLAVKDDTDNQNGTNNSLAVAAASSLSLTEETSLIVDYIQPVTFNTESIDTNHATRISPSITSFKNKLFCCYMASDDSNKLYLTSSSDGTTWPTSNTRTDIHQTSSAAPAIATFDNGSGEKLYCAFKAGYRDHKLLITSSSDGTTWPTSDEETGQTTSAAPALCSFKGKLYCAFTSNDSTYKVLITSSSDGSTWDSEHNTGGVSESNVGPSLAVLNDKLYCAYMNQDKQIVVMYTTNGTSWNFINEQGFIGETTIVAPSLTVVDGILYCCFRAEHVDHHNSDKYPILVKASHDGLEWYRIANNGNTHLTSSVAPSVTNFNETLYVANRSDKTSSNVLIGSSLSFSNTFNEIASYRSCFTLSSSDVLIDQETSCTLSPSRDFHGKVNGEKYFIKGGSALAVTTKELGQIVIEAPISNNLSSPDFTVTWNPRDSVTLTETTSPSKIIYEKLKNVTATEIQQLTHITYSDSLLNNIHTIANSHLDNTINAETGIAEFSFSNFKSLYNEITNGAEPVQSIEVGSEGIYTTVTVTYGNVGSTLQKAIEIRSVYDALDVIALILEHAGTTINDVAVWIATLLGGLFPWTDIISENEAIKGKVHELFTAFTSDLNPYKPYATTLVHNSCTNLTSNAQSVTSATDNRTIKEMAESQDAYNTINQFGATWSKASWLLEKVPLESSLDGFSDSNFTSLITAIKTLLEDINSVENITGLYNDILSSFSNKLNSGDNGLLKKTPSEIADLVTDYSSNLNTICSGQIDNVFSCANSALTYLSNQYTALCNQNVDIPILSPLYKAQTTHDLKYIDLLCLQLAFPAYFLKKSQPHTQMISDSSSGNTKQFEAIYGTISLMLLKIITQTENNVSNFYLARVGMLLSVIGAGTAMLVADKNDKDLKLFWYMKAGSSIIDWILEMIAVRPGATTGEQTAIRIFRALLAALCIPIGIWEANTISDEDPSATTVFVYAVSTVATAAQFIAEATNQTRTNTYNILHLILAIAETGLVVEYYREEDMYTS